MQRLESPYVGVWLRDIERPGLPGNIVKKSKHIKELGYQTPQFLVDVYLYSPGTRNQCIIYIFWSKDGKIVQNIRIEGRSTLAKNALEFFEKLYKVKSEEPKPIDVRHVNPVDKGFF